MSTNHGKEVINIYAEKESSCVSFTSQCLGSKIEEANNKTITILLLTQATREIWIEKEKFHLNHDILRLQKLDGIDSPMVPLDRFTSDKYSPQSRYFFFCLNKNQGKVKCFYARMTFTVSKDQMYIYAGSHLGLTGSIESSVDPLGRPGLTGFFHSPVF